MIARRCPAVLAALAALLAFGCASGIDARPAPGFIEVKKQSEADYDFRAVAPEGVAFAARLVPLDHPPEPAFWENALKLRMQELDGYEFLAAAEATAPDGRKGRELSFGHDESGKAFLYRIRVFVDGDRLLVLEAGGPKEEMQRFAPRIDWMFANARLN